MKNMIRRIMATGVAAASLMAGGLNVLALPVTHFTPSLATQCALDGVYDVNISSGFNTMWYSFTAPEAGVYAFFTSDSGDCDPYLLL